MNQVKNNDYYVYVHRRKDNNEIFYVGKGRRNRCMSKHYRNKQWNSVVSESNGFTVEFLFINLSEEDALKKELEYVYENKNILVNKRFKNKTTPIDKLYFSEKFYYDSSSPSGLRYKVDNSSRDPRNKRAVGDVAGYIWKNNKGKDTPYYVLEDKNISYRIHRIIWVLEKSEIPEDCVVNHIDLNSLNNTLTNLELVSPGVNSRRSIKQTKSGVLEILLKGIAVGVQSDWTTLEGKRIRTLYSYKKYGKEKAWKLATQARQEALVLLNEQGAGYKLTILQD